MGGKRMVIMLIINPLFPCINIQILLICPKAFLTVLVADHSWGVKGHIIRNIVTLNIWLSTFLSFSLPDRPKRSRLLFLLCLTPDDFNCQGRASGLGGNGLTHWSSLSSLALFQYYMYRYIHFLKELTVAAFLSLQ